MAKLATAAMEWLGAWSPGRGPGWSLAAVPLYCLAAWQSARLARGKGVALVGSEGTCWWILGAALLALGIYELLDLQTALTQTGRILAREHHWYRRRRPIQLAIILGLGAATAAGTAVALWLARRAPIPTRAAAAGGVALVGFVAVRTISFHYVDLLLDQGWAGLRVNGAIEIGGIAMILVAIRRRVADRHRTVQQ